jgi:hypothetical protein
MAPLKRPVKTLGLALPALLLAAFLLVLPGCGCDCHDTVVVDTWWGNVFLSNLTDAGTPEFADSFYLAPVDGDFTANLLSAPLAPGRSQFVGTFSQGDYDGEANMELGDLVTWEAIFVGDASDAYFEIY